MKLTLALLLLLLVCVPGGKSEEDKSTVFYGNGLYEICSDNNDKFLMGVCLGYVQGVERGYGVATTDATAALYVNGKHDMETTARLLNGFVKRLNMEGVTGRQSVDLVVKYLRDHPESRNRPSGTLIMKALDEAFGIPTQKP